MSSAVTDPHLDVELDAIARSTDLHALEQIVFRGKRNFLEVGAALCRIHDGALYKLTHGTWENYCKDRFGWSRGHGYRLMAAFRVSPRETPSERHARELVRVPPEQRAEVLAEAGVDATAAELRQVVERRAANVTPAPQGQLGLGFAGAPQAQSPRLQTRRTPRWLFDALDARFGPFILDAFAEPHNALCERFYTREDDGCAREWADVTFGNPEFDDMRAPLEHAARQAEDGKRSVIIGPVGCSQSWYHEIAIRGTIYVPDVRINFDMPDGAPTRGADRDTIVMAFGGEHRNKRARDGVFRVLRLELSTQRKVV